MQALTIVARNYLPQARVLAGTFLEHHPGASFATLVIDGTEADRVDTAAGEVLLIDDIGLPTSEWRPMAAIYDVMELATALKAAAIRHLLLTRTASDQAVAYIDPDIQIMAPIGDVFEHAVLSGIALTPHMLEPLPRDGRTPDEAVFRYAGIFNLGFACVGHRGLPFLDWWHERLRTDCVVDLAHGLFTDQRWVDWAPSLFPVTVERDPGLNVAYWNIHERTLRRTPSGAVTSNGRPLRFFHFSGYDPRVPWQLSKHAGTLPRRLLSDDIVLRELCDDYRARLEHHGFGATGSGYGFDAAADGTGVHAHVRAALRDAWLAAARGEGDPPPDPFDPLLTADFAAWSERSVVGPPDAGIRGWELALYRSRPDLQAAFPFLQSADAYRFRDWLDLDPAARQVRDTIGATAAVAAPRSRPAADRNPLGWNVVGYHLSEHGVGEAARRVGLATQALGLQTTTVGVAAAGARHEHPVHGRVADRLEHRDSIYCVNADEVGRVVDVLEHRSRRRDDAHRIGLWFWELSTFPPHMSGAAEFLDEVWVTSEFAHDAIQPVVGVPVRTVPLAVTAPSTPTALRREHLGLHDGFLFTCSYDFNSILERKNPIGTIDAYRAAFGPDDGATLLVKSINGHRVPLQLERVRWAAAGRSDIVIIDEHWTNTEMQALTELADCVVSLHRSEGFGLNLAAAMAVGTPVVATGYSGNLSFMDSDSSVLVPYELVEVGPGNGPYDPAAVWAAPDLAAAADGMRHLFDHPDHALALGDAGRRRVMRTHSIECAAAAIEPILMPALAALR